MSRIGKKPIEIPKGVEVKVDQNNVVTVKGPLGQLSQKIDPNITIELQNNQISLKRPNDEKTIRALHGLSRALIQNMVIGVTQGFSATMEVVGVGYKASANGQYLELSLGYSHDILFEFPKEIKVEVTQEKRANPFIKISTIDKQLLGQVCAKIRSYRMPEPYKGKGILFVGEQIRRKVGKKASA